MAVAHSGSRAGVSSPPLAAWCRVTDAVAFSEWRRRALNQRPTPVVRSAGAVSASASAVAAVAVGVAALHAPAPSPRTVIGLARRPPSLGRLSGLKLGAGAVTAVATCAPDAATSGATSSSHATDEDTLFLQEAECFVEYDIYSSAGDKADVATAIALGQREAAEGVTYLPSTLSVALTAREVRLVKVPSGSMNRRPLVEVQAIVRGTALLPCDIEPPAPNDSVILAIWFKNEMTPFYSYDARGRASESASHWRDKAILGERGYFRTVTTPATLSLSEISERDEGVYRCRVDFRQSPSRNTRLNLTVVVPPQRPTIFDELGRELVDRAGPYEEGGQMRLTCIVTGGRPPPSVLWWRGERLLDALELPSSSSFPNVRKSQLVVPRLRRADLGAIFTCQAANNNISQPAQASVSLDLNFSPTTSTLLSNRPLDTDMEMEVLLLVES
ncbi:nectin-2-like [Schistocerca piceifrons]|uniref:nectin-2-like n=1 Tax=Schistocerca piceifrons TaxID=274613 RepID=UPI001F5FE235|nr:nectin-2-like [Schistocerca piceifrons]